MHRDLTKGPVMRSMYLFAIPMMLGNLLQQCYNIVDTLIVGRFLGPEALAAVGSSFTLMTFLTSILLGLCMGSGAYVSICFGKKEEEGMKTGVAASFLLISGLTIFLTLGSYVCLDLLETWLKVPAQVWGLMRGYLLVIFAGIPATFFYNYFSSLLRAVGNSLVPLLFLGICALLNIGLDFLFVLEFNWGVEGAAFATVISQYLSGIGVMLYTIMACPLLRVQKRHWRVNCSIYRQIGSFSILTCVQQSVMNLGILMIQGLVNSFGPVVMAAFAAAVKIDAFAYMPLQDFGNAFSTFIAQNHGAGQKKRIKEGLKGAVTTAVLFGSAVSVAVWIFAEPLMCLFVDPGEIQILSEGVRYLRIEGAFYYGIGCLFLLYGLYRALGKPGMSVVLTVISLGTRVVLAYLLSPIPAIGVAGIWWAIPIGWILADVTGAVCYLRARADSKTV